MENKGEEKPVEFNDVCFLLGAVMADKGVFIFKKGFNGHTLEAKLQLVISTNQITLTIHKYEKEN